MYARALAVWGFGIVQSRELERAGQRAFAELCDVVAASTSVRLRPFVAQSHAELTHAIDDEEVALAWLPPIPTIELEAKNLATVLAIPFRNATMSYHCALIARRGLRPKKDLSALIEDLRGIRAAWVEPTSAAGYLVPRMQLAALGVDLGSFFAREIFTRSHPAVVEAIVSGQADVGATYCHVDRSKQVIRGAWLDEDGRASRPIEVLTTFGPIPNDALVVSNLMPVTDRAALTRWLLDSTSPKRPSQPPTSESSPQRPAGPRVRELLAQLLGASDFRMPSAAHYDPLRHLLRTARVRGTR